MSSPITSDVVRDTLIQTFEDAAFIFAEPTDEAPEWEGPRVEVQMSFQGPEPGSGGSLLLTASREFATKLAANLLGVEMDDPNDPEMDRKAEGALSELLNIYAGFLVSELYGQDVVCQLGIPQARPLAEGEASSVQGDPCCAATLLTDEGDRVDVHAFHL